MAMAWVWTGMVVLSLLFGLLTGRLDAVANAALHRVKPAGGVDDEVAVFIGDPGIGTTGDHQGQYVCSWRESYVFGAASWKL